MAPGSKEGRGVCARGKTEGGEEGAEASVVGWGRPEAHGVQSGGGTQAWAKPHL